LALSRIILAPGTSLLFSPLIYWGPNGLGNDTYRKLLENKAGQCGAWADLFARVLRTAGIGAQCTIFLPKADWAPTYDPIFQPDITPNVARDFLIDSRIAGQNNALPRNRFTDHDVVRLSDPYLSIAAFTYFDPSYGTKYLGATWADAEIAWSNASVTEFEIEYSDGLVRVFSKIKDKPDCQFAPDLLH
jgi:hypothetical protein